MSATRNAYLSTLPVGTGFCFPENEASVWVVRAKARYDRYSICTSLLSPTKAGELQGYKPVLCYTLIDWELNVRGKLNGSWVCTPTSTTGEDAEIRQLCAHLENRSKIYGVREDGKRQLAISEVIFALDELTESFVDLSAEPQQALLTAADRCDRCSAQAYVRVTLESGQSLDFCGHHYTLSSLGLLLSPVADVHDQRDDLLRRA